MGPVEGVCSLVSGYSLQVVMLGWVVVYGTCIKEQWVRVGKNFSSHYLRGKYGGMPYLGFYGTNEEMVCEKEKG